LVCPGFLRRSDRGQEDGEQAAFRERRELIEMNLQATEPGPGGFRTEGFEGIIE
jgi:hypothetical protein